jgi:TPR repeat protein
VPPAAVVPPPVAVAPPVTVASRAVGDAGPAAEGSCALDPREVAVLVKRGQDLLSSGDVQSARLLLMRGAEARDARAALLVGTTYDPALLRQIGADGPLADAAQARTWYQRAKEWGEPDAQRKLDALALWR